MSHSISLFHSVFLLSFLLFSFMSLIEADDSGTCSPTSDCDFGCCSNSGFCGFGPEYCGSGNCTSSCDAVAECGPYAADTASYDCPLNVCCSKYGFCGTTELFCGDGCVTGCDTVEEPSCSGASSDQSLIGYYESWSYKRACDSWKPEDITPGLWTQLNYAFALINSDYQMSQMNTYDEELYTRFTGLKSTTSNLKTFISVGGWDAGGKIFSDMVSTSSRRSTFIASAISFMSTYGFDGIDIDWEYPAAEDRDGVAADTANYVTFLKELKAACGSRYGISVTLPSSYWYLQGFDVVSMEQYVDTFNFMSYDIHGTWDGNSPYTSAVVQPHTNLTEIATGLDLLWRNGIKPAKVVLGMGFYGRSFTLSDSSCTTPGCPFSGGGTAGECTATSGILSNAEIRDIISEKGLTPILDKEAGVKYMTWDTDQWVSYDDDETYELKRTFANNKCLGGRMVWALDLDDADDETSITSIAASGLADQGDDVSSNTLVAKQKVTATSSQNQISLLAYWGDCRSEPYCNDGFQMETIGHGKVYDADTNSFSADGCHGGGNGYNRAFCVESDVQLGGCKWYGKPKNCGQTCPAGTTFLTGNTHVGGAKTGCKTGYYSVYCCESITANSMTECPASTMDKLVTSGSGSSYSNAQARQLHKDDSVLTTPESCAYAAGDLVVPGTVLVLLAGYWLYKTLGRIQFIPLYNRQYGSDSAEGCTTTTTETILSTHLRGGAAVTSVCNGNDWPQACSHYSSVISRVKTISTVWCPLETMKNRALPAKWDRQHHSSWRSWISSLPASWGSNTCERDEYPAFRFMANDVDQRYTQWLRFLPRRDNNEAGKMFSGVCKKAESKTKVEGGPINGKTCTEIKSIDYTVDALSLSFINIGAKGEMSSNPCRPSILTDDPGYALMIGDEWYTDNILRQFSPGDYKQAPAKSVTSGVKMPKKQPKRRWYDTPDDLIDSIANLPPSYYPPTDTLPFDPDEIHVDEGNSSRRATDQELLEAYGLVKCRSENCEDEKRLAGLYLDDETMGRLLQPTAEPTVTSTAVHGSFPSPIAPVTSSSFSTITSG